MKALLSALAGVLFWTSAIAQTVWPPGGGGGGQVFAPVPPNSFYAGPTSGTTPGIPSFRPIIPADIDSALGTQIINPTGVPATDTTAFQSALTAVANGGTVHIAGCGTLVVNQSAAVTLANTKHINIVGDGGDCTEIEFTGANHGLTITWAGFWGSVNLQGFALTTDQINIGTGISLLEPFNSQYQVNEFGTNNIYDVSFRGHDRFSAYPNPTQYWGTAFFESGLTVLNVFSGSCNNLPASPNGICYSINGPPPDVTGLQSVEIGFFGTSTASCGTGWFYGSNSQGIALTAVNSTGCNFGVNTTTDTSGPDQLSISQSQFNNNVCAVCINDPSIATILISNNSFIIPSTATGLKIQGLGNVISNNSISGESPPTSNVGILIAGSAPNAGGNVIANNTIGGLSAGIKIAAGVSAYAYANLNNMQVNTADYVIDYGGTAAWAQSTAYTAGTVVHNNSSGVAVGQYTETATTCTSASSGGGPTGTGTGITDNTCSWNYVSQAAGGLFIIDYKARNLSAMPLPCNNSIKYSAFLQADSTAVAWTGTAIGGGSQTMPIWCNGVTFNNH